MFLKPSSVLKHLQFRDYNFPFYDSLKYLFKKSDLQNSQQNYQKNLSWDNIPMSYRRQLSNVKFLTEIFSKKGCSFDKHHQYDQNLTRKHIGRSRHAQVYKQKKKLSCNFSLHWKASKALHDGYFATEFKRTNLKCTLNYLNVNVDII